MFFSKCDWLVQMSGTVFVNGSFRDDLTGYLDRHRAPKTDDEFKYSSCDVYLRHACEPGESIYLAHSAILTFHSRRLREDFKNKSKFNLASDGRRIVDISKEIDEKALILLIDYMYQGRIQVPNDNSLEKANVREKNSFIFTCCSCAF